MSTQVHHYESGFNFDKTININNTNMNLVSLGNRTKFGLTIYGIALYSDNINISISDYLSSNNIKCLIIKIYRKITSKQMIQALVDAFNYRIDKGFVIDNNDIIKLKSILSIKEDLLYNDNFSVLCEENKTIFYLNNECLGYIENGIIGNLILNCYLDENSITPDLKKIID